VAIDDLVVNPWSVVHGGRFEPLDASAVRLVHATIRAEDLRTFLAELKGFARTTVRLDADAMEFAVALPGPDVHGRVRVVAAVGRPFALEPADVRVGGIRVPAPLVSWVFPESRSVRSSRGSFACAGGDRAVRVAADGIYIEGAGSGLRPPLKRGSRASPAVEGAGSRASPARAVPPLNPRRP
jgi:hypothetical protein